MLPSLQYILPHHFMSRVAGWLANWRYTRFKNWAILRCVRLYPVNMSEASISDPRAYACFNDFFTRLLKEGVRPMPEDPRQLVSPVDGTISALGTIQDHHLFTAKKAPYSLQTLLGGKENAARFENGTFVTVYLAPHNYHRVHMPIAGTLSEMIYVPGRIFSVNPQSENAIPRLFTRNERVISIFETAVGPMAVILVGAMMVGHIDMRWHGQVAPGGRKVSHWQYTQDGMDAIHLQRGEELGHFKLGSTIILLFGKDCINLQAGLNPNHTLVLGQPLCYPK